MLGCSKRIQITMTDTARTPKNRSCPGCLAVDRLNFKGKILWSGYNSRASSSYFFLFCSAYSYFSYFLLAISSYFSYFLAILHVTCISFQGCFFSKFLFFISGAHKLFLKIFQPHFLWHYFIHI